MTKSILKILVSIIGLLTIYQQSKSLVQDIFKLYKIESAVVIKSEGILDTSDGQNSFNPLVTYIVKLKNGNTQSVVTNSNNRILVGDTVICKLYSKNNLIFIEHNGKDISPSNTENLINWIVTILIAIFVNYFIFVPFYQKYFKKNDEKD